jgi:integrase
MATIRKKGPYQWHVQIRRKAWPTQTRTFNSQVEAKAWATMVEREMDLGSFVNRGEAETTTFGEASERYSREITCNKRSNTAELSRITALLRHPLASRSLANCRGADMAAYRDERLAQGMAAATVRRELALISHVFTIARKEWRMESLDNPVQHIRMPTVDDARHRRIMSKETWLFIDGELKHELLDELELIRRYSRSPELPAVVTLAVESAMRRGEIIGLQRSLVDLTKRVAFLPLTKNGSARGVPLSTLAVTALKSLPKRAGDQLFSMRADTVTRAFADAVGYARVAYEQGMTAHLSAKRTSKKNIERQLAEDSFLLDLRFHDLRHEATSRLAEIFPLHELTKITGHQDTRMLMRYYHPRAEDLAKKLA